MKRWLAILATCLWFALPASAQDGIPPELLEGMKDPDSMQPAEQLQFLQQMVQGVAKVQLCYQEIGGDAAMKDLEARGRQIQQHVKSLCAAQQRDAAQAYAKNVSRELQADTRIQKLQTCAQDLSQHLPALKKFMNPDAYLATHHICDEKGNTP